MLKIAEYNTITGKKIDLKKLEKYGAIFKYDIDTGEVNEIWFVDETKFGWNTYIKLRFSKKNIHKILFFKRYNIAFELEKIEPLANFEIAIELLYDLIKDGYVEKI